MSGTNFCPPACSRLAAKSSRRARSGSAPISLLLSNGLPTRSRAMRLRRASSACSETLSCIKRRAAPVLRPPVKPSTIPSMAESMSASSNTRIGGVSSNSSMTVLPWPEVNCRMARPASVGPSKAIMSTPSCCASMLPARSSPVTMFNTPSGSPAVRDRSASSSALRVVLSEGLMTTVSPAASAGASRADSVASGAVSPMITAQTPCAARPGNMGCI